MIGPDFVLKPDWQSPGPALEALSLRGKSRDLTEATLKRACRRQPAALVATDTPPNGG
jgi:hypothetical protein